MRLGGGLSQRSIYKKTIVCMEIKFLQADGLINENTCYIFVVMASKIDAIMTLADLFCFVNINQLVL